MDKYEYKVRADEIKELIREGEYALAAEVADSIDWRRVKSVMMLCMVSDLYKINRRYEDAKSLLLLAYEKRPGGKTICYSLCELYIKTGDLVNAVKYCKEYAQVAPKDSGRYILQYKIYEAQDVRLEERIAVLEELKKRDYREKWAYELAYLYHRIGLASKCVEECDEMILWFGEGKYVIKAMELKMLHQPLNEIQQEKYEHRFDVPETYGNTEQTAGDVVEEQADPYGPSEAQRTAPQESPANETVPKGTAGRQDAPPEELDIQVKTMDVGKYNTINLQAELAAGLKEVLDEEKTQSDVITHSILAPLLDAETRRYEPIEAGRAGGDQSVPKSEEIEESEVFFGETGEISGETEGMPDYTAGGRALSAEPEEVEEKVIRREAAGPFDSSAGEEALGFGAETLPEKIESAQERTGAGAGMRPVGAEEEAGAWAEMPAENTVRTGAQNTARQGENAIRVTEDTAEVVMRQLRDESQDRGAEQVMTAQPPEMLARVLSQEPDGQLSLVVPKGESVVEKQITGQMNIGDVLNEWERIKRENEEKRREEVRQHVIEQTGDMFTKFEESIRDSLLEKLENGGTAGLQVTDIGAADEALEYSGERTAEVREETDWEEQEDYGEVEELEEIQEEGTGDREPEARETDIETADEALDYSGEKTAEVREETGWEEQEDYGEVEELEEIQEEAGEQEPEGGDAEEAGLGGQEPEDGDRNPEDVDTEEAEAEGQEPEDEEDGDVCEAENGEVLEAGTGNQADENPAGSAKGKSAGRRKRKGVSEGPVEREKAKTRALTKEEKELFAPFIQSSAGREKLIKAIDNISMAAYTGNIIITGEAGMDKLALAKSMIQEVQMTDSNFSGKVARISGQGINSRNVEELLEKQKSGALIIEAASGMEAETVAALHRGLQQERLGIIVILTDTKRAMANMLTSYPQLKESFTARMDMEAMSNEALVTYGKQYAREMEYSIDDLGVLALHTRIEEKQTIDHAVTAEEVRKIVDDAIWHANRKTPGHFFDILFAKRYDEEDMIILTEKDFA